MSNSPKKHGSECAMYCNKPAFGLFMQERYWVVNADDRDEIASAVRAVLGISSRSELNHNMPALAKWINLRGEFNAWMMVGAHD